MAVVTGEPGERIQAWRRQHDPDQAQRLPPHATLCYWAPSLPEPLLEEQVRHSLPSPVRVGLGRVRVADNDQRSLFVEMLETQALDQALERLYDGTFARLPPLEGWRWHVTCVRDSRGRDLNALLNAARDLILGCDWLVDTVAYLELRGGRYEPLATWRL